MRAPLTAVSALFLAFSGLCPAQPAASDWEKTLNSYNITWTEQSTGSPQSMPLSGGVIGLNVWVEKGDVCFLIGSPNSMDENGMSVKLGLVRLRFDPDVFAKDFRQELDLAKSEITLAGKTALGDPVEVKLWCSMDKPIIHVDTKSASAVLIEASLESWSGHETKFIDGGLQWMKRLADTNARRQNDMKAQKVEEFASAIPDPLSKLTMGGRLLGQDLVSAGTSEGKFNGMPTKIATVRTARPVRDFSLCIPLRMEQDATTTDWEKKLSDFSKNALASAESDRKGALEFWDKFWNRSHISINPAAAQTDKGWLTGRNYQLARYQLASNTYGRQMTLFNGGNFACEGNPDRRMWEGCQFMAQNQRLILWPLLRSGDFDMCKSGMDFYRDRAKLQRLRAKKFWDVDGLVFSEGQSIFGMDSIGVDAANRCSARHLSFHFTSCMDFAYIMLEYARYTGQDISSYLPVPEGIIEYYDNFYQKENTKNTGKPLDDKGLLVIYPSDALELFHECKNNSDVIAGLRAIAGGLLELPDKYLTKEKREYYKGFLKRLAPIPVREEKGKRIIAPAESWKWVFPSGNMEFPNMYVLFPFNTYSLGRKQPGNDEGLELAGNTWDVGAVNEGVQHQSKCWYQSAINLARLGRTAEATDYTLRKFVMNPALRFPTFWTNYGFCHAPDTDHAGCSMIGLQEMIMQCDGKRILLGAAWPQEWRADFKLLAPYKTVVEGHVADGKVVVDKVTPEERRKDIEIFPLKPANISDSALSEGKPATASAVFGGGYEAAKAVDGDESTRWAGSKEANSAWLEVDLGQPVAVSRAVMMEKAYAFTQEFAVEAQLPDGSWKVLAEGKEIGKQKEVTFPAFKAQKFRLNLKKLSGAVNLEEFRLFAK